MHKGCPPEETAVLRDGPGPGPPRGRLSTLQARASFSPGASSAVQTCLCLVELKGSKDQAEGGFYPHELVDGHCCILMKDSRYYIWYFFVAESLDLEIVF